VGAVIDPDRAVAEVEDDAGLDDDIGAEDEGGIA
jgi:hypothetical protein